MITWDPILEAELEVSKKSKIYTVVEQIYIWRKRREK